MYLTAFVLLAGANAAQEDMNLAGASMENFLTMVQVPQTIHAPEKDKEIPEFTELTGLGPKAQIPDFYSPSFYISSLKEFQTQDPPREPSENSSYFSFLISQFHKALERSLWFEASELYAELDYYANDVDFSCINPINFIFWGKRVQLVGGFREQLTSYYVVPAINKASDDFLVPSIGGLRIRAFDHMFILHEQFRAKLFYEASTGKAVESLEEYARRLEEEMGTYDPRPKCLQAKDVSQSLAYGKQYEQAEKVLKDSCEGAEGELAKMYGEAGLMIKMIQAERSDLEERQESYQVAFKKTIEFINRSNTITAYAILKRLEKGYSRTTEQQIYDSRGELKTWYEKAQKIEFLKPLHSLSEELDRVRNNGDAVSEGRVVQVLFSMRPERDDALIRNRLQSFQKTVYEYAQVALHSLNKRLKLSLTLEAERKIPHYPRIIDLVLEKTLTSQPERVPERNSAEGRIQKYFEQLEQIKPLEQAKAADFQERVKAIKRETFANIEKEQQERIKQNLARLDEYLKTKEQIKIEQLSKRKTQAVLSQRQELEEDQKKRAMKGPGKTETREEIDKSVERARGSALSQQQKFEEEQKKRSTQGLQTEQTPAQMVFQRMKERQQKGKG